jgi:hypothetical protein
MIPFIFKRIFIFIFFIGIIIFSCSYNKKKTNCIGSIKGYIVYPGEGIPSDLIICAIDTTTKKEYRDSSKVFSNKDNRFHFRITLPQGIYYVCAEADFVDTSKNTFRKRGFYTEFMEKKLYIKSGNASHNPIPVKVDCDSIVENINVGDFWE